MQLRRSNDLLPLIETAYAAAVEPDGWTGFLDALRDAVGADAAIFQIHDLRRTASGSVGWRAWWRGTTDETMREYPQWIARNPHLTSIQPQLRTGLIRTNTVVPRRDFLRSEYYNDFLRQHGQPFYALSGCCVHSSPELQVIVSADRLAVRPNFDSSIADVWRLLFPHLQRAVAIHRRLGQAELAQAASMDVMDRIDNGVVLLSEAGRMLMCNEAARILLAGDDGLRLQADGRVTSDDLRTRDDLDRLILGACKPLDPSARSVGGAARIPRGDGRSPVEALIAPLRLKDFPLMTSRPAAVLFLRDPDLRTTPLARLQQLFDLTVAEARVAQMLAAGGSVTEIADSSEVGVATVRTHVRRLLAKVGARSLSDLTRRLASLFPVR